MLDLFRGRFSWRKFANLLARLPGASAYRQAVLDDPEVAEQLAAGNGDESGPPPAPPLTEWTPDVSMLAKVVDQLQALRIAVIANGGSKPPSFIPERRPITEVERAALRRELRQHDDLVNEVKAAQVRWEQNQGRRDVRE